MNLERSERVASETSAELCIRHYQSIPVISLYRVYILYIIYILICKVRKAACLALPCAKAVPGLRILREDACLMPSSDEQQEVLRIDASSRDRCYMIK